MKKIEIYTSDTCPNCIKLKEFLAMYDIDYDEYNISRNAEYRKELIKEGFMSVPVMKIEDDYVLGFDITRIKQLLSL